ncbi:MAG: polyprenyl synthetase family protein [Butyrivibrio sp.]|jgi:geranylgeranyl diphosphate synthase type II|nr:polyprenyl synthetase family protein [Butyrivibrio sp.]
MSANTEFESQLQKRVEYAEQVIEKYLPAAEGNQKTVIEAMNYSVLAGGKRLRPVLLRESFELFHGTPEELAQPFMAAMEMIHTYSLVHDDLPAMDNDEYRRGRKTTHAVYGAGMATLAGDGLLNYAFETALKASAFAGEHQDRLIAALKVLGEKAGIYGMVGGQCADIEAEKRSDLTQEELLFIHENKTAAMIESSLMIGAILAGAAEADVQKMQRIGHNIGVAFQIQDDILDVTGNQEELGKPIGSDEKNGKTTYVTLFGLEKSKQDVAALSEEAVRLTQQLGEEDAFLLQLIRWLISREK